MLLLAASFSGVAALVCFSELANSSFLCVCILTSAIKGGTCFYFPVLGNVWQLEVDVSE